MEEGELVLEAIPDRHLIDVVEQDKGVEGEHEDLHAINGWKENLLQVLSGFWRLRHYHVDRRVVELDRATEGSKANDKHDNVLYCLDPD